MADEKNQNVRTYTVVIETDSEIPALECVAVRVDATSRAAAENFGWRWARENDITATDITVYLK